MTAAFPADGVDRMPLTVTTTVRHANAGSVPTFSAWSLSLVACSQRALLVPEGFRGFGCRLL